jgi:hypothetical protein
MRRLFGADSLRSNNRFSRGPSPLCGEVLMRRLFAADSLRSNNAEGAPPVAALRRRSHPGGSSAPTRSARTMPRARGPPPLCGEVLMRRLFGADSLRSNNRFSRGPSPPCGEVSMRRLFGADSLRSNCHACGGTLSRFIHCG